MIERLKTHLTYANVMATLAVFIALGGTSYAVTKINGSQIKDRSVSGKKLKRNTLGGVPIKESRLGVVRRAKRANDARRLQGASKANLRLHCPAGLLATRGVCIEPRFRSAQAYAAAENECGAVGRRLPSYAELVSVTAGTVPLAPGGELTNDVFLYAGGLHALVVASGGGGTVTVTKNNYDGRRSFRCVAAPTNR